LTFGVNRIENRADAIFMQLATDAKKSAINRIAETQNMKCPPMPDINPCSIWRSLSSEDVYLIGLIPAKEYK